MTSILRRSHYNLRPRTARVTSYQTIVRSGKCTTVFRLDLETTVLAAQAQERHEEYLAGDIADAEDPEVEEADVALDAAPCTEGTSMLSTCAATTRPIIPDTIQDGVSETATTSCNPKRRAARTKDFSKTKKRHARVLEGAGARYYSPYVNRSTKASAKIKKQQAEAIHTEFAWSSSVEDRTNRVAKSAMVGVRLRTGEYPKEAETKEQSLERGLDEINWDGEHDMTIVDAEGRVVVYLARKSADMEPVLTRVEQQFEKASELYRFKPSQMDHRRGKFKAAPCAASYGSGQQRVGNLKDTVHNKNVLERELLKNDDIINLAGFVDAFQNAAYDLHEEYGRVLTSICENDSNVRRNFANSVFAGVTFNFGPQAATVPHTDHLNIPTGWCAVVALGDFNADEGGHLILWDLNLVIRFPRGAIIFLPSALFVHSNTVVPNGQRRYSFTQYTAGGLARWVECGFQSQKQFLAGGGRFSRTPQQRWEEGLARFPNWDSWLTE